MIASDFIATYEKAPTLNPASLVDQIEGFVEPAHHFSRLKELTMATDDMIAYWLNVNVKTYRSYRDGKADLKPDVIEHLVMLTSLARHGVAVFGDGQHFGQWLHTDNFMLGQRRPADLLNTNSGVRLVDDRLTGMEYGDNA